MVEKARTDPLRFMVDDATRLRVVCNTLEALAGQPEQGWSRREIKALISFLTTDVPLAVADQEDSLFPVLAERAEEKLTIFSTLELLGEDHRRLAKLAEPVIAGLRRRSRGRRLDDPDGFRADVAKYVTAQRHHIGWEERALLPQAEASLTGDDRRRLGRSMARRRDPEAAVD